MIGRRARRAPGRHRIGQPATTVHRRLWDGPARAEAERLALAWPSWTILYGVGSRRFHALATWQVSEPLVVEAATAEDLERRMYEAVMAVTTHRETPLATPTPALPAPPSRRGGAPSQVRAVVPLPSRRPYRDAA